MSGLRPAAASGSRPTSGSRRGFSPLRDLPVVCWLALTGVAALVHPALPAPRWLLIHLLLLGAVSHAILVWSRHFADALLHTAPRPGEQRAQSARLLLLNGGAALVVCGVAGGAWPLVVPGASAVAAAVIWHGAALVARMRRALPSRFGVTVRYYVAAAAFLPVGATLGTVLARNLADPWDARLRLAHAAVNLLGWMGLTIVGTLVTLWPTMLRTRIADGSERAARRALPILAASVLVLATAAALGVREVVVLGLGGYLGGLAVMGVPLVRTALAKPPASYATWSVAAALLWLVGCLLALAVALATASSWADAETRVAWFTPFLAAGCGAQILLGALSYLVPTAMGGGPTPTRRAAAVLDKGAAFRVSVVNGGLLVAVLPVPGLVRVPATVLVLGGLAAFLPLLFLAIRASRRARAEMAAERDAASPRERAAERKAEENARPAGWIAGQATAGFAAVVLAVAVGVALDPSGPPGARDRLPASDGVQATGETRTIRVRAEDMRFTPSRVEVPAGTRVVLRVTNTDDEDVHDLVLDTGADTGRLAPGESATLDVGVVGRDVEGWCSVVGHRQMGMVFTLAVIGAEARADGDARTAADRGARQAETDGRGSAAEDADGSGGPDASGPQEGDGTAADASRAYDPLAEPGPGFTARDAVLPPRPGDASPRVHRRTFTVTEVTREVAPGVRQRLWTYDGSAPGPVLHGRVGDTFEITIVNDGSIGHSIDFHAGSLAPLGPRGPMRTIPPGESLVYRFRADKAGVWMYHCSTEPMSAHIANGMFGAVVIEPPGLPEVDREYVLVQSEFYLGEQGGPVDVDAVQAERPDIVAFNGYARQYDADPLEAKVGERVRIWVLDAGPNRSTSFHVVGGRFDTVYREGAPLLRRGSGGAQSLALAPGQGGFVELTFPEPGRYPFVSHVMIDAERGAHGFVEVGPR